VRLDHITPNQFGLPKQLASLATNVATVFPGGHSEWEPPDPIPNSEVKLLSADDSVGPPHVKVGHRQDPTVGPPMRVGLFIVKIIKDVTS
jgi:hypothetical protein